jgi:hypothetical protein
MWSYVFGKKLDVSTVSGGNICIVFYSCTSTEGCISKAKHKFSPETRGVGDVECFCRLRIVSRKSVVSKELYKSDKTQMMETLFHSNLSQRLAIIPDYLVRNTKDVWN